MATFYELDCERCRHRSRGFVDYYGAFLQDDGVEVPLLHPGELDDLQRLGSSLGRAQAENRLKSYVAHSCHGCGTICYRAEESPARPCEQCGSAELSAVRNDELLICPSCKRLTARVRCVGIS
jgi:hypothetical protein